MCLIPILVGPCDGNIWSKTRPLKGLAAIKVDILKFFFLLCNFLLCVGFYVTEC